MRICDLMDILRKKFEPLARQRGLTFSIAPDPQSPYSAILNGGSGGLCILCYSGQSRIDDTPYGRVPVGSRFELFISSSVSLTADKSGGGALFRANGPSAPLYAICEEFETEITSFVIPGNDGLAETRPYYEGTDPAVMPAGYVLNAYKLTFRVRRVIA